MPDDLMGARQRLVEGKARFREIIEHCKTQYWVKHGHRITDAEIAKAVHVSAALLARWLSLNEGDVPDQSRIAALCGFFSLPDEECKEIHKCFEYSLANAMTPQPATPSIEHGTREVPPPPAQWWARRPIVKSILSIGTIMLAGWIFIPIIVTTLVVDYPSTTIATLPDCAGDVKGRILGRPLPFSVLKWQVLTNEWYSQKDGVPEGDRFVLRGYFSGLDDYPHTIKIDLVELGGLLSRVSVTVPNVKRSNPCQGR